MQVSQIKFCNLTLITLFWVSKIYRLDVKACFFVDLVLVASKFHGGSHQIRVSNSVR